MRQRLGRRRPLPALLLATLFAIPGCSSPASPAAADVPATSVPATSVPVSSVPVTSQPPTAGTDLADPSTALVAAPAGGTLRGKVVVIDPGHNGANWRHPGRISRRVDIGNGRKACDTTGAETNAGYPEPAFTFDVSTRLAALLRASGATVVLTRPDNRGVGPCITERAAIGNREHADVAISIHADGAPARAHGFHVIVPKGIGRNDAIVRPSRQLGIDVRDAFARGTGEPLATYTGTRTGGLVTRGDLGGLNLSTVPKVFIECGNMRNAADARRMTSPAWRQRAAASLAAGITTYLTR